MADVRPFRALRYDPARADIALTIAPPYDIISSDEQAELYGRSSYNAVRIEYGEQLAGDNDTNNRYTRAAADVAAAVAAAYAPANSRLCHSRLACGRSHVWDEPAPSPEGAGSQFGRELGAAPQLSCGV